MSRGKARERRWIEKVIGRDLRDRTEREREREGGREGGQLVGQAFEERSRLIRLELKCAV